MKVYKKDGSEVELAEKEYVDSKCKYIATGGWDYGNHDINLYGVNMIILNIQNDNDQTYTIPFIASSHYVDTYVGINITVNFNINQILVSAIPEGFKIKSYLLIY